MVWHPLPLEEFEGYELEKLSFIPELPKIVPNFDVAPLEDKPQNPILDSLKLSETNESLPKRQPLASLLASLPPLLRIEPPLLTKEEQDLEFWKAALERRAGVRVCFSAIILEHLWRSHRRTFKAGIAFAPHTQTAPHQLHFYQNRVRKSTPQLARSKITTSRQLYLILAESVFHLCLLLARQSPNTLTANLC